MTSASVPVDFKKMLKKNLIKYAKNHDIKINQTLKKQQIINKLSDKSNDIDVKKLDFSKLKKQELLNFAKSQSIKINPALKKDAIYKTLLHI